MLGELAVSEMVMVCEVVIVPPLGLNVGVGAGGGGDEIVYAALATPLGAKPLTVAMAWTVADEVSVNELV